MSIPHSDVIVEAILGACQAIHTDNGDSFTPVIVQRFDRENQQFLDLPAIQIYILRVRHNREESGGGNWRVTLQLRIDAVLDASDDQSMDRARADIGMAIANLDWEALEANLSDIDAFPFHEEDVKEPENGIALLVTVQYKVEYSDFSLSVDPS